MAFTATAAAEFYASECMFAGSHSADPLDKNFYIHIGGNQWINTTHYPIDQILHLVKDPNAEYVKEWKCPYCNYYWPHGKPCGNPECPSKFKDNR